VLTVVVSAEPSLIEVAEGDREWVGVGVDGVSFISTIPLYGRLGLVGY